MYFNIGVHPAGKMFSMLKNSLRTDVKQLGWYILVRRARSDLSFEVGSGSGPILERIRNQAASTSYEKFL
jgi:hypothetical protein